MHKLLNFVYAKAESCNLITLSSKPIISASVSCAFLGVLRLKVIMLIKCINYLYNPNNSFYSSLSRYIVYVCQPKEGCLGRRRTGSGWSGRYCLVHGTWNSSHRIILIAN